MSASKEFSLRLSQPFQDFFHCSLTGIEGAVYGADVADVGCFAGKAKRVIDGKRESLCRSRATVKKVIREAVNLGLIVLGILSAGLGLKGFLLSSRFIDGGVTGVSMLLADVLGCLRGTAGGSPEADRCNSYCFAFRLESALVRLPRVA